MSKLLFALFISLTLCVGAVWADDIEDGLEAHKKKDYSVAIKKFKNAAATGNSAAQFILGSMYASGEGVLQDYVKAHMWFNMSAMRGITNGNSARDMVAERMTTQQVAEAQKLARECQARDFKNCD